MSWLGDVLKHLELSKKFTAAIFASSLAMLLGPKFFPSVLDAAPNEWRWLIAGTAVFSGVLLTTWTVPPICKWLLALPSGLRNNPRINVPTPQENTFLLFLGEHYPNDSVNLANLRYEKTSKLETLEMCAALHRKGLVRVNEYQDDLVSLTANGRKHALELIRAKT